MKCIECGSEISVLFEEPVKGNIMLTNCKNCGKIADKFIEYEYTLIFLNLILCKSQAYRHILYNIDFCNTKIDLFMLFAMSCIFDTLLFSCGENFECWILGLLKNNIRNSAFLIAILISASIAGIKYNKKNLLRAILLSSFGKLGSFMIVTWDYSTMYRGLMLFFIYLNNVISVKQCLDVSYLRSLTFVGVGVIVSLIEYQSILN